MSERIVQLTRNILFLIYVRNDSYKYLSINLGERVSQVLCIVALLVVPITTYMNYYPHIIIEVLLGPQWQLAGDILGVMS
jgi:hypothetical protein